jgi:hypothetical protein
MLGAGPCVADSGAGGASFSDGIGGTLASFFSAAGSLAAGFSWGGFRSRCHASMSMKSEKEKMKNRMRR